MSLREQVLRGGAFLIARQGLGLVLSLAALFLVTKIIGPSAYGVYASALGLVSFVLQIASLGVNVYLVRSPDLDEKDYQAALALYGWIGLALLVLAFPIGKALQLYTKINGLDWVTTVLLLGLPVFLIGRVFLAKLERTLDFAHVAVAELAGSLSYLLVAVPLAWQGWGYWAPSFGWLMSQGVATLLYARFAAIPLRPRWHWERVRAMLEYGMGFSASLWVWQIRILALPLVVAPLAGPQGAGYVALAVRLVEALSFVKSATWRLSISALARVQQEISRLRYAVEEGMYLQVLALGPFLLAFAWLGPWLVPRLLGEAWSEALLVYPFIALAYLVNGVFSLHSSALYVLRYNWQITLFHFVHVVILFPAAWWFVGRLGFVGYGLAELAAFASYVVIHRYFASVLGALDYKAALWIVLAFGSPLFWQFLGVWAFLPFVLWLISPGTWRTIALYAKILGGRHG
jgi:O-antigen/teichoic acid export membrane protein